MSSAWPMLWDLSPQAPYQLASTVYPATAVWRRRGNEAGQGQACHARTRANLCQCAVSDMDSGGGLAVIRRSVQRMTRRDETEASWKLPEQKRKSALAPTGSVETRL